MADLPTIINRDSTGGTSHGSGTSPVVSFPAFRAWLEQAGIGTADERLARHLFQSVGASRLLPYVVFLSASDVSDDLRTVRVLHDLFVLERDVRSATVRAVDVIETRLKAQCIRSFCSELGPMGLYEPANFKHMKDYRVTLSLIEHEVARMRREGTRPGSSRQRNAPLPVAIEVASFGSVSRLLSNVRNPVVASQVAASFSANKRCLISWLKTVNIARNSFAHFNPYIVRRQIPLVPKAVAGVSCDHTAPLYILHVVARLLEGAVEAGDEWVADDLQRFESEVSLALGRFAWRYPELAVQLRTPPHFVDPYVSARLPNVTFVELPRREQYSECLLAA